jgi:hypothetical protein
MDQFTDNDTQHPITTLPFVRDAALEMAGEGLRTFWNVTNSGDYAADCERGNAFAIQTLALMRDTGSSQALTLIVRDMVKKGGIGGTEIGFLSMIAMAAMGGYRQSEMVYSG